MAASPVATLAPLRANRHEFPAPVLDGRPRRFARPVAYVRE